MTTVERFTYECMSTIELADVLRKKRKYLYDLNTDKKHLKLFGTDQQRDKNKYRIVKAKTLIKELETILKSRQMRMF